MKIISKEICSMILLLLPGNTVPAQDINKYRSAEAIVVKMNGAIHLENKLEKVILVLPNNSNEFHANLVLPYHAVNNAFDDNEIIRTPGYSL